MARLDAHPSCQIPNLNEIYDKYLPAKGMFVEVGAFDGMTYSNTWHLANDDWKGIYIEAHPDFANQCHDNHKGNNVEVITCACGATEGEIDLIVYGEVSTTVLSRWNRDWGMNESTPKIKMEMLPLDYILFHNKIECFDLLVIDVEEAEIEVLKGFTLESYLPKMIIIELHEAQGTRPDQKGWQTPWVDSYLNGYKKVYFDTINTIYVRES